MTGTQILEIAFNTSTPSTTSENDMWHCSARLNPPISRGALQLTLLKPEPLQLSKSLPLCGFSQSTSGWAIVVLVVWLHCVRQQRLHMCWGSQWFEKSLQIRYLTFTALLPLLVVCDASFFLLLLLTLQRRDSNSMNMFMFLVWILEPHLLKGPKGLYLCLHLTIWSEPWSMFLKHRAPNV